MWLYFKRLSYHMQSSLTALTLRPNTTMPMMASARRSRARLPAAAAGRRCALATAITSGASRLRFPPARLSLEGQSGPAGRWEA